VLFHIGRGDQNLITIFIGPWPIPLRQNLIKTSNILTYLVHGHTQNTERHTNSNDHMLLSVVKDVK